MPIPTQYNEPQSSTQYYDFSQMSTLSEMGLGMPTAEPSAPPYLELRKHLTLLRKMFYKDNNENNPKLILVL